MLNFVAAKIPVADELHPIVTHFGYPVAPSQPNSVLIIVLDVVLVVAAVAIVAALAFRCR